ncbi:MAG: hypothetical protein IJL62_03235 [Clostridia bacterium]|nr:hypothetical protein [Clostridia bacterium]
MSFEKLTGLVNLEELEKESDLNSVVGGTKIWGGNTCAACDTVVWDNTRQCRKCVKPVNIPDER